MQQQTAVVGITENLLYFSTLLTFFYISHFYFTDNFLYFPSREQQNLHHAYIYPIKFNHIFMHPFRPCFMRFKGL
jgi:hypothetical protein